MLPENASWSFDENGNIVGKTVRKPGGAQETRTLTYDAADRLVSLTRTAGAGPKTMTLSYDENGNLVSDSTGRTFTWNALDQLTRLKMPRLTAHFTYDPLGRRTSLSKGAASRSYFYNGLDILTDGRSKFLHGAGIDEPVQMEGANQSLSYLSDYVGSTTQLFDIATG